MEQRVRSVTVYHWGHKGHLSPILYKPRSLSHLEVVVFIIFSNCYLY